MTAGKLDAGGMEDHEEEEEEITADSLRYRPRPLPLSALSYIGYIPLGRRDPKEHSYFSRPSQVRRLGTPRERGDPGGTGGNGTWPPCRGAAWRGCPVST